MLVSFSNGILVFNHLNLFPLNVNSQKKATKKKGDIHLFLSMLVLRMWYIEEKAVESCYVLRREHCHKYVGCGM